jgi:hypothetical protein
LGEREAVLAKKDEDSAAAKKELDDQNKALRGCADALAEQEVGSANRKTKYGQTVRPHYV